jgi:hypothetical protein
LLLNLQEVSDNSLLVPEEQDAQNKTVDRSNYSLGL